MFNISVQIKNYSGSNFQSVPVTCNPFNVVRSSSKMPPKRSGGIKKRMAQAEDEALLAKQPRRQFPDVSDAANSSAAASSSSTPSLPGGIRKRLDKAASKIETTSGPIHKPLTKAMKQKWGNGKMSAKEVAEVFIAAGDQGARDVPQLSSLNKPQNLHRSLVSAFGHPVCAPDCLELHPFERWEVVASVSITPSLHRGFQRCCHGGSNR